MREGKFLDFNVVLSKKDREKVCVWGGGGGGLVLSEVIHLA